MRNFSQTQLKALAREHEWSFLEYQENIQLISFVKVIKSKKARLNIYMGTSTVGACIDHPSKGKTQMFRKKVNLPLMIEIFKNPRVHTDKGYRKKN